jgi:hypothetical protein
MRHILELESYGGRTGYLVGGMAWKGAPRPILAVT